MKNKLLIFVSAAVVLLLILYYFSFSGKSEFSISPDRFEELTKENGVVILDVRSNFEFGGDKIKGAVNMSYTAPGFDSRVSQLDKDKTYLVYCATGSRSAGACSEMKKLGFKHIYNLSGGFEHWKNEGMPVTR